MKCSVTIYFHGFPPKYPILQECLVVETTELLHFYSYVWNIVWFNAEKVDAASSRQID